MSSQDTSMKNTVQRIYLSRHGQTNINALAEAEGVRFNPEWPEWYEDRWLRTMTPRGHHQADVLAGFFRQYVVKADDLEPKDILVVTSKEPRSLKTGERVRKGSRIPKKNHVSSDLLKEAIPREILLRDPTDSERYRKKLRNSRPKADIVTQTLGELQRIMTAHPDKTVIATLHGMIDYLMLEHVGIDIKGIGNCCLIPLDYDHSTGRVTLAGDYTPVEKMAMVLNPLMVKADPYFRALEDCAFMTGQWNHGIQSAHANINRIIDESVEGDYKLNPVLQEGTDQHALAQRLNLLFDIFVTRSCKEPAAQENHRKHVEEYDRDYMHDIEM
ncbi:histidine phosphatase family protein [Candidatus Woesearchaeota archaeon]|nr:histidine phosphatase family protein [Candidatus Woesearchaeota archaeon]